MSKILIVGDVVEDVYLRLDEFGNDFERDERGVSWLDLGFDGREYGFFEQTSVYGGALVAWETLNRLGLEAEIVSAGESSDIDGRPDEIISKLEKSHEVQKQYLLCRGDEVVRLAPTRQRVLSWVEPKSQVDWIYVLKSARLTSDSMQRLMDFAKKHGTKIAMYLAPYYNLTSYELAKRADLIFTENQANLGDAGWRQKESNICEIGEDIIIMDGERAHWRVEKRNFMTRATICEIISATVLGGSICGKTVKDTLSLAKINVEHAKLNKTLSLKQLEKIMDEQETDIKLVAKMLVAKGKGILAADESGGSIHKKFEQAGITDDEEHRRDYRNIFFTTEGLEKYASGVILFEETARQKADDGRNFVDFLTAKGVIAGIKVDQGLVNFSKTESVATGAREEEKYTKGLKGLPDRLAEYYDMGLRFAKWRAAFEVKLNEDGQVLTPTDGAIAENCRILARYAKDCQEAGIVPIVEPEVVHDGDYSIEDCKEITEKILRKLFDALAEEDVELEGCILKCNMVLAGKKYERQSTPEEVGKATTEVLLEAVPKKLAGVMFLSGGQGVEQATENLREVRRQGEFPFGVTFSFARALQEPALEAWRGDNKNTDLARKAFYVRLKANAEALGE